jgi:hypothetical protein
MLKQFIEAQVLIDLTDTFQTQGFGIQDFSPLFYTLVYCFFRYALIAKQQAHSELVFATASDKPNYQTGETLFPLVHRSQTNVQEDSGRDSSKFSSNKKAKTPSIEQKIGSQSHNV